MTSLYSLIDKKLRDKIRLDDPAFLEESNLNAIAERARSIAHHHTGLDERLWHYCLRLMRIYYATQNDHLAMACEIYIKVFLGFIATRHAKPIEAFIIGAMQQLKDDVK